MATDTPLCLLSVKPACSQAVPSRIKLPGLLARHAPGADHPGEQPSRSRRREIRVSQHDDARRLSAECDPPVHQERLKADGVSEIGG